MEHKAYHTCDRCKIEIDMYNKGFLPKGNLIYSDGEYCDKCYEIRWEEIKASNDQAEIKLRKLLESINAEDYDVFSQDGEAYIKNGLTVPIGEKKYEITIAMPEYDCYYLSIEEVKV